MMRGRVTDASSSRIPSVSTSAPLSVSATGAQKLPRAQQSISSATASAPALVRARAYVGISRDAYVALRHTSRTGIPAAREDPIQEHAVAALGTLAFVVQSTRVARSLATTQSPIAPAPDSCLCA